MTNSACKTTIGANNKNRVVDATFNMPMTGKGKMSSAKMM